METKHFFLSVSLPLLLLLLLTPHSVSSDPARFDNFRIYNVTVKTPEQLSAMQILAKDFEFLDHHHPHKLGQDLKVYVAPHRTEHFEQMVVRLGMYPEVLVPNVQSLIDKQLIKSRAEGFALDQFNRFDEISNWLNVLTETHPDVVTSFVTGESYEGRAIQGVKLSKNPENPAIFIDANIHGNEWLSSAALLWIVDAMLTATDPEVSSLLENYNWYILPIANPDGYEFTHTTYRDWRKTRSRNGLLCWGTDPTRNFGHHWQNEDDPTRADPCSNFFAGKEAFSESETRSLMEFVEGIKDEVKIYVSLHSAYQLMLAPYGYTDVPPENIEDYLEIMEATTERLKATHGVQFEFGTVNQVLCEFLMALFDLLVL